MSTAKSSTPPESGRLAAALALLQADARPGELEGMARFGIVGEQRLGLSMPSMRRIAKSLGRDHALALELWSTGIPDAQIVAGMVADPARLTSRQMDAWAGSFSSWDVCDQVCGSAFLASPLAWPKVAEWANHRDEFVRRAAFALLATLAVHDKAASNEQFIAALRADRGRLWRRSQLREKGRQLGAAQYRQTQRGAEPGGPGCGAAHPRAGLPIRALDCGRRTARTRPATPCWPA